MKITHPSLPIALALPTTLAFPTTLALLSLCATPALARQATNGASEDEGLPLEPTRTISFTTTEGSWISLDVSPDGSTIVFDLLGDLYTVPIAGGRATRITSGIAFDGQPRFSPDGTRIAYTSDLDGGENVWIMSLDGSDATQLTEGKVSRYQSPEWTPDGEYIVVSRTGMRAGVSKLWMFHTEGGQGVQLVKEPRNLKMMGAAFGPDERYIWYSQRTGNWNYNAQFPQYQLYVYDRDTGRRFRRTSRYGSGIRPTLSPDGRWLAYGTRYEDETGIRIRDLSTGVERWLAYPVQHDDQESRGTRDVLPAMSFTPDSRELVAPYGGRIWRIPIEGGEPIEIPVEVDVIVQLGPKLDFDYSVDDSPTFVARQIRDAVPSPDGSRIAFTLMRRLYAMDFPDGEPRRLTDMADVGEHMPTWSPDGQWIAYVTWSEDDGGHIYRARANERGSAQRLTETAGTYTQPAWSPDGARIMAVRGSVRDLRDATGPFAPGARDFVWIPSDGGAFTVIAPTNGRSIPHFTSDSSRIYMYSSRGLLSMRWDGTDEKAHMRVTGATLPGTETPSNAGLVMMAPEGKRALAQVGTDLYVVTVPYVGGETPTVSVAKPDSAAFPVRRLTDIGGQFPAWSRDGRRVHWSIGNAHFVYDLDAARAFEDSVAAAGASGGIRRDQEASDNDRRRYRALERRIEIAVQRDVPQGVAVLRGARVITMRGNEVIENADIVVRNNRIEAVGRRGTVQVPADAEVIDVAGRTIIPGFVDTHSHMWPSWGIHKNQVWIYLANLAYGVTTTRDPQTGTTDVLTYADRVESGELIGPRIYSTGPGVLWQEQIKSLDHARDVLKRYSEYYDTKTIKMYVAGNRQMRQWIIMAAREQRLMPTTEGSLNLKMNLMNIIDGYPGHEHSFPIYPLYRDVIDFVAEAGTTYTPTLLVSYGGPWAEDHFYATEEVHDDAKLRYFTPHEEIDQKTLRRGGTTRAGWFRREQHVFDDHAVFVKDLVEAGGRAGVGSHGQLQGLGYHWELWAMQSGGLSEHDALRVATIFGAEAIGLDNDLGSIDEGKLADLIVLDANPLDGIRNTNTVRMVMKNGRLYDGDRLNEIWPTPRQLDGLYWQDKEPNTTAGIEREGNQFCLLRLRRDIGVCGI